MVLFAFVLAFVGCNKGPENGCKCSVEMDGKTVVKNAKYTLKMMKKADVSTCSELEDLIAESYEEYYEDDYDYDEDEDEDFWGPRKAAKKSSDPDVEVSCEDY